MEKPIKKVLRIFVSSVGKMMEVERNTLRDKIWKSSHIPIGMEAFSGNHSQNSIDVVISNLKEADIIIFVFGYTYGSVIGDSLKCNNCLVKDICKYKRKGKKATCAVSYTHFEYMYAQKMDILHYCIVQKHIEDVSEFKNRVENFITTHSSEYTTELERNNERNTLEEAYYAKKDMQIALTSDDALKKWSYFYDAKIASNISATIADIYNTIASRFATDAQDISGLIDGYQMAEALRKKNTEINSLKKENSETTHALNRIIRQLAANQPNTAVTGTCIPFEFDKENNEIVTYLICNSAYKQEKRLMFPGGHAFINDESPEAIAIAKALTEAGLEVKTVDLYDSFDVSSHPEKEITSDFTVYRPPHYCYYFKQHHDAKCYAKNHLFHFDAVYVFEIVAVHSELECSQERVPIRLPNKILTVPKIHEALKNGIKKFNETKEKNGGVHEEAGEYIKCMLFEAHRDYVKYLRNRGEH